MDQALSRPGFSEGEDERRWDNEFGHFRDLDDACSGQLRGWEHRLAQIGAMTPRVGVFICLTDPVFLAADSMEAYFRAFGPYTKIL